jgi:hypothetical protein
MPWAGGSYTKGNNGTGGWAGDASLGIGIEAGRHDTQDNDFATGINQCINKDGSNSFTGNANLGGFRPTNIAAGTAAAPALCVGNDVNTGVFGPAADTWAVATNGVERLRVDDNGRVGIGTTSPVLPLQVERAANDTDTRIAVRNTSNGSSAVTYITIGNDTSSTAGIIALNSSANATGPGGGGLTIGTQTSTAFTLRTNNTERMRIASDGTVGIGGLNDSTERLRVVGSDTTSSNFSFAARSSTTLVLCVRNDGRVGIGTGTPSNQLTLSTDSAAKPTTNTWTISSDQRIKTNIQPYAKGLGEILQVNPITYDYNGKGGIPASPGGVSILAQELQPVFPECVGSYKAKLEETDQEETDILNYNGHAITFALINAVKELNAKVEALEARVAELEA